MICCEVCGADSCPGNEVEDTLLCCKCNDRVFDTDEIDRLRSALQAAEREREEALGALLENADRSGIQIATLIRDRDVARVNVARLAEELADASGKLSLSEDSHKARETEVKLLHGKVVAARAEVEAAKKIAAEWLTQAQDLSGEVGRLREALRFYADGPGLEHLDDNGERARKALEPKEVTGG